jgi:hypothetical protein
MNNALLDTDIYSEILRAVNATVTGHVTAYRQAHGRLSVSVITVMEMVKSFPKRLSSTGLYPESRQPSWCRLSRTPALRIQLSS